MKYAYRDLLTLLISLFIFGSCTNPTGIGLEVKPEDQINALFTDTVTLRAFTVQEDSVQSGNFNQTLFGLFRDPLFGTTNVGLAMEFSMAANFAPINNDAIIDSVILVLPYGNQYYGDTTLASTFALQVHPLEEPYEYSTYSTKKWKVKPEVIGTRTMTRYAYKSTDSLTVNRYQDGKDTTVKVGPQLRIALDKAYFKDLFSSSHDSAKFATAAAFREHVKGLYMSVNASASNGMGGLVTFMNQTNVSGIEMVYTKPKQGGELEGERDTVRHFFEISPVTYNASQSYVLGAASSVENTYKQEVLDAMDTPLGGKESIYLHAPTGLRGRIVFPYLDYLKGKRLTINKAELVLYVDKDQMAGAYDVPAQRLTLYRQDIAGQRQNIPDGAAVNPNTGAYLDPRSLDYFNFGGWYEKDKGRYVFHITSYIQDVIQGKINGNELFIAPVSVMDGLVPTLPALNAGGRVILGGGNHPQYKMKLNIYYTENLGADSNN
jgi:hypothetical protein